MRPKIVWWRRLLDSMGPRRKLRVVEGDSLPAKLPLRDLVLTRDGQETGRSDCVARADVGSASK